jgi:Rrf2 family transcriptional regulator, iron-sulfur cluster assembly transcription factor
MLSQAVGYAATALSHVAAAGGKPLLVKEIAEAADMPAPYLAKIIQSLARKGIVNTQRGIGGGVTLGRAADSITLYELAVALDDPCVQTRCMLGVDECSDERACPCHKFWTQQRGRAVEFMHATTVADMAAFEARRRVKASISAKTPSAGNSTPANVTINGA